MFSTSLGRAIATAGIALTGALVLAGAASAGPITFQERSVQAGISEPPIEPGTGKPLDTWGTAVADWTGDGCDDLYIGRHNHLTPKLYRNVGNCTATVADESSRIPFDTIPIRFYGDRHSMAFGDYDGDGRQDLFIPTGGGRPGFRDQ